MRLSESQALIKHWIWIAIEREKCELMQTAILPQNLNAILLVSLTSISKRFSNTKALTRVKAELFASPLCSHCAVDAATAQAQTQKKHKETH